MPELHKVLADARWDGLPPVAPAPAAAGRLDADEDPSLQS